MNETSLVNHLIELRKRLLRLIAIIGVLFLGLSFFANNLYHEIALPLLNRLPQGSSLIATTMTGSMVAPLRLAFVTSLLVALPYILYEIWGFIAPGLYQHEKRWVMPLLAISTLLFYVGGIFAYFVVLPMLMRFFIFTAPLGVQVLPDINHYLDFTLKTLFSFGIAFEVPVITVVLIQLQLVSLERLVELRPYVVVGSFILGMFLSPPDVISQVTLALPMWGLFEVGLWVGRNLSQKSVHA